MGCRRGCISYVAALLVVAISRASSFHCLTPLRSETRGNLRRWSHDDDLNTGAFMLEKFKRRKIVIERKVVQSQWRRPPNPVFGPLDLVSCLLEELRNSKTFSGVTSLLESSSNDWREVLRKSVGAPEGVLIEQLAPPLEAALGRPGNQFAILLGVENQGYLPTFPTDPLEYENTCWLECRLRSNDNDELLVAMGWSLERRPEDGAWVVSKLDWQDFRDAYRPGVGREEWERICG